VDRRGGRIEVGNDEGAVFMVRIPLAAILTADPMPPEAAVSG
jgi:hypothetical protein